MKIAIIGSGTWGSALGKVLADNGHKVMIYGQVSAQVDDINKNHENRAYFPYDIELPHNVKATTNLAKALNNASFIILSVPTNAIRSVLEEVKPLLTRKVVFVNTAKGFDPKTNERMSEVIREIIPSELRGEPVSLIGPSHAEEVVLRHITAITATSISLAQARKVQKIFSNEYFRVYTQTDEVGAEIGVAMKNAIALASGMLEGMGMGDNAKAALVTRGLAEIVTFGRLLGGKAKTYLGLTGLGDLMVTCNSKHSRNFMAGYQIGRDDGVENFFENNHATVEGIRTTEVIYNMAKDMKIELPIINGIYAILYKNAKPSLILKQLMIRPLKKED